LRPWYAVCRRRATPDGRCGSWKDAWVTLENRDTKTTAREWCIQPKANAGFAACMEDVLDGYTQERDKKRPKQMAGETRTPFPVEPGNPGCFDMKYMRNGPAIVSWLRLPWKAGGGRRYRNSGLVGIGRGRLKKWW
jgi:hypothetical protein